MSIFFSSSAILLQILVQSEICVLFNVNSSDNYIFINLMACLACVISFGIEFVLRKKLILIKDYLKKEPVILKGFIWLPLVTAIVAMFFYCVAIAFDAFSGGCFSNIACNQYRINVLLTGIISQG